jgi:Phosphotransferase enzyme family
MTSSPAEEPAAPEFAQAHTQGWTDYFRAAGHPAAAPLAAGVEGALYDLGDGTVAKVWGQRTVGELELTARFYADVAAAGLPFKTPEILAVSEVNGRTVSYEAKLPGRPLQERLTPGDAAPEPGAARCVIDILRGLSGVAATASMRQLAVLDETTPFRAAPAPFTDALRGLLRRRADRFGPVLRARVPNFDRLHERLGQRLTELDEGPDTVIHGDLFPGNILADESGRPLAVLDFGFLTTAGDPRFDAAIATSILNMYAPAALGITRALTAQAASELGYPVEVLLVYQAAYALATANAFTADGSDGHFAWCAAQLARPEIAAALGARLPAAHRSSSGAAGQSAGLRAATRWCRRRSSRRSGLPRLRRARRPGTRGRRAAGSPVAPGSWCCPAARRAVPGGRCRPAGRPAARPGRGRPCPRSAAQARTG